MRQTPSTESGVGDAGVSPPEHPAAASTLINRILRSMIAVYPGSSGPLPNVLSGKYNKAMNTRDMARALGRRGGRARARNLTPDERRRIAALGGAARRRSLELAERHRDNFIYAAMVLELQPRPRVDRMRTFDGPLPGLYPDKSGS